MSTHNVPSSVTPSVDAGAKPRIWTAGTLVYTTGALAVLFFWLLWGDFALNLRERSIGDMNKLFLKGHGASDTLMALLITSFPAFLGMILGPIVSYKSDRYRSRWGRRIPFLIIPTPIAALAMIGIAFSPNIASVIGNATNHAYSDNTLTLITFSVFWTIFEVAAIISGAVFGGLINDVVPRQVLGRFFGLFRAVSLFDGIIFNSLLLKHATTHFVTMYVAIATVFGVGFLMMCFRVKEGEYPPPPAPEPTPGPRVWLITDIIRFFVAAWTYLRECFSNPYYLLVFAALTLGAITFQPINTFSINYGEQLGIRQSGLYGNLVAGSYAVSILLAYPIGMLVDKFHALRVGLAALVIYAFSTIWGALYITDVTTFSIALVIHTVLSGSYFTATASLAQALFPKSRFAEFASATGIVSATCTILINPIVGRILDSSGHNYRLTFLIGFLIACLNVAVLYWLYLAFMKRGGPRGYVAPE